MATAKLTAKRWEIREADEAVVQELRESLKIHEILCRLLVLRGITTYDDAFQFFRMKLDHLHDPFLMKDMDKAVARIHSAISSGERILIYGDYDVDGTTAVALVYKFFAPLTEDLICYQPDREKEGYGVSRQGIDFAADNGIGLIIALDCGIKAEEQVRYAAEKGIDFIICDHHLPGDDLPPAVAVLDPKRADDDYPYKELCGCGIGFKLAQAYAEQHDIPEDRVYELMDLLAVAVAADIVPMTGENRVMTWFGLRKINRDPSPGIAAILKTAQFEKEATVTDLVFVIAPRINAAGRLHHASLALELLLEDDREKAMQKAADVNENNTERRTLDARITGEALAMIESEPLSGEVYSTVLYDPEWHKGVIGIVASRVIESQYRPTVILTRSNGKVVGSARSVSGFDLYQALEACSDDLIQFGGHKYAAGLTMDESAVPAFKQHFEEAVAARITEASRTPVISVDAELNFDEIDERFYDIVRQLAPFGPGNRKPVFLTRGVMDSGQTRIVKEDHLKLEVHQPGGGSMRGIAFGQADKLDYIHRKTKFDVCYQLQLNEWNGYRNVEMMVKDIR